MPKKCPRCLRWHGEAVAVCGCGFELPIAPDPPPTVPDESPSERLARRDEARLARLERRLDELPRSASTVGGVGWLLLTFGQVVSVLGCMAAPVYALDALSRNKAVQGQEPLDATLLLTGATLAFLYSAAMLVVFTRCKRAETEVVGVRLGLPRTPAREGSDAPPVPPDWGRLWVWFGLRFGWLVVLAVLLMMLGLLTR